jgi:hypothetical protein
MQPTSAVSQWLRLQCFRQVAKKGQSDLREENVRYNMIRVKLMLDIVVGEKVGHFGFISHFCSVEKGWKT